MRSVVPALGPVAAPYAAIASCGASDLARPTMISTRNPRPPTMSGYFRAVAIDYDGTLTDVWAALREATPSCGSASPAQHHRHRRRRERPRDARGLRDRRRRRTRAPVLQRSRRRDPRRAQRRRHRELSAEWGARRRPPRQAGLASACNPSGGSAARGRAPDGAPVSRPASQVDVIVAGGTGSGKSFAAGLGRLRDPTRR